MTAQWIRCPRCQVALQVGPSGPSRCGGCGADLTPTVSLSGPSPASWFVIQNKQKVGPLSQAQLQQMSQTGQLRGEDMVLQEGTQKWVPASSVAGLLGATVSLAPASAASSVSPSPSQQETVDDSRRTGAFTGSVPPKSTPSAVSVSRPPSATPVPSIPGYEILGELGRGGMGVVYKARQTALKRLVALKMILSGGHAAAAELSRFRAEAEAVARLQHPNIVQIHEIGEHDGLPYFSLEYVGGGTLSSKLNGTPLPALEAAQLIVTLAQAIEAAHQAGIIHRDLKPANILLASGGREPPVGEETEGSRPLLASLVPKITDFGLAKQMGEDTGQTRTGAIVGTPSYMAPEQAGGQVKDIGRPTDVYALGAILYECLTGRPPFRAASVIETLEQVRTQDPLPPSSLQPRLPADLETICLKCLNKEPAGRYPSARELAEDLQRFLRNEPILARPASLQERALKFVKRNRLLVGSAGAVFLVLLLGMITTSVQAARARRNERAALKSELAAVENHKRFLRETASRALSRGHAREGIAHLQAALESLSPGDPDWAPLKLDLARANATLYRSEEVRKLLDELEAHPNLGTLKGSVLLLRAYTTMGREVDKAVKTLHDAIRMGLPPAEEAFARGLLADTSPQAIDHFKKALEADAAHHPSRILMGLLLVLLGRHEEADRLADASSVLYPDDHNLKLLRALVRALQGRMKEATEALKLVKPNVTDRQYRVLEATVELLGAARRVDDETEQDRARVLLTWAKLARDVEVIWPSAGLSVSKLPEYGAGQLLEVPPMLMRSLGKTVRTFATLYTDLENDRLREDMEDALRTHPEGSLYYFYGMLLFGKKRLEEARVALRTAAQLPGVANVRRLALVGQLTSEAQLLLQRSQDRQLAGEAFQTLRQILQLGGLRAHEFESACFVAVMSGNLNLARALADDWEQLGGRDRAELWLLRMDIASIQNSHTETIRAADQVLRLEAGNRKATQLRTRAVEELRKQAAALK